MPDEYDADEILARMRGDAESDWPTRLLSKIAKKPLVDESMLRIYAPERERLTPSELRALEAVSRGMTGEMAAELLGVAFETIQSQLKSARYRLRAKNTTHACCEAIRRGLIR